MARTDNLINLMLSGATTEANSNVISLLTVAIEAIIPIHVPFAGVK